MSLERGLEILGVLCDRGPLTVEAVASAVGIPLSTTYRYLTTLRSLGYVEVIDGRYDVGARHRYQCAACPAGTSDLG